MSEEFYIYETCENDRWDLIASKFYGNCFDITPIIEANIHIPIKENLNSGIEILIPKKAENNENKIKAYWKKG